METYYHGAETWLYFQFTADCAGPSLIIFNYTAHQ